MSPGSTKGLPGLDARKYIMAIDISHIIRNILPDDILVTTFSSSMMI